MRKRYAPVLGVASAAATPLVLAQAFAPTAFAYNGNAAGNYAERYWGPTVSNYNSHYPAFTSDCTDFVSEALHAGGLVEHFQLSNDQSLGAWFEVSKSSIYGREGFFGQHSNDWTVSSSQYGNTDTLEYYLGPNDTNQDQNQITYNYSQNGNAPSEPSGVDVGDIFFYNFNKGYIDHATVKVGNGTDSAGYTGDWIDSHTNNRQHLFWTTKEVNGSWQNTTIYGKHIK